MTRPAEPFKRAIIETRRNPSRGTHYLHLLDCGHIVSRQASLTKRSALCGFGQAAVAEEDDRRAIWDRWRPEPVKLKVVGSHPVGHAAEGDARTNVACGSMPPGLVAVGDVA